MLAGGFLGGFFNANPDYYVKKKISRDTIESLQISKSLLEEEFVRTKDQLLGRAALR
jgi:hypothetical protein